MSKRSLLAIAGLAVSAGVFYAAMEADPSMAGEMASPTDGMIAATTPSQSQPGAFWTDQTPAARAAQEAATWRADQVVVTVHPDADFAAVATDHAVEVVRAPGRSGMAAVAVPDGIDRDDLLAELRLDPRVRRAGKQGIVRGAGGGPDEDDQWHLDAADFDESPKGNFDDYVVAVLDTGVAYEAHSDSSGTYVATECLEDAEIVSPRDIVNADDHPNDDHQHGTHIASTIVADCDIQGTAPGAMLMPVKVLDQDNSGVESDLVEGILWAVDHGADVINMSLTFSPGYVPSPELLDALEMASQAGVVMVGAAGNDGIDQVGWPAASPQVIAVGASCAIPDHHEDMVPAPYSNHGPQVDLLAPGGCLDRDVNDDDMPDGILAESFPQHDPTTTGYWLFAGTSQAAAVVSGAAIRLLETGIEPQYVKLFLQDEAEDNALPSSEPYLDGHGAGALDIEDSVEEAEDDPDDFEDEGFSAAMLPMLRDNGDGTVTPGARWTVLDEDLDPAEEVRVYGTISGEGGGVVSCWMPDRGDGACTVWGDPVPAFEGGDERALAWEMSIDIVADDEVSFAPSGILFASERFADAVEAVEDDLSLTDAVLGISWVAGDRVRGDEMAESWVVLNAGTGISTSPFGVLLTPPVIEPSASILDGKGISTSPFGIRILSFDGTGISTSPFGLKVLALRGTGISTSPFGAMQLLTGMDEGHDDDHDRPKKLRLDRDCDDDDDFRGTALARKMKKGGWKRATGEDGAHAVAGSGMTARPVASSESGAAVGAAPYED